ncbi:MAG: tRNA (adenosine(37)-N6)-threonylcarbamoyltransferase complex dimerization subunit type 1 TsaB [bacterium]|nr:tRNA (adenosine(37)-N6)-threonylcarbamoyltransferase complex dimerization subunit type 1 TsaB [bacterium]
MISLFLDTSSSYFCACIVKDQSVLKSIYVYLEKDMSKYALVKVKEMMDELNLKPNDVDEIIVVNGPGSYTGLRVGVTIAKTYAWGLSKKLAKISSLYVMATSVKDSSYSYIVPVIDARRGFVFAGIYDKNYNIVMQDSYISIEKLQEFVSKLDGKCIYISREDVKNLDTINYNPDLENLFNNLKIDYVEPHLLVPNYLKKTEAEENLNCD